MKISVIIPTYNEAENINTTIQALTDRAVDQPYEIIVVDSGSLDGTTDIIRNPGVVVATNSRLAGKKWRSLRLGANLAQGDILLFLDADTLVPEHYDQAIAHALAKKNVIGGAFEFSFDKFSLPLYCISIINRFRYRVRKRFYGDQGIFVRRKAYEDAGGWPERSLLEAAYFCKNLQKHGRLQLIRKPIVTSSRRFTEGGVWRVFLHDFKIWLKDLLGMSVTQYGSDYWLKARKLRQVY